MSRLTRVATSLAFVALSVVIGSQASAQRRGAPLGGGHRERTVSTRVLGAGPAARGTPPIRLARRQLGAAFAGTLRPTAARATRVAPAAPATPTCAGPACPSPAAAPARATQTGWPTRDQYEHAMRDPRRVLLDPDLNAATIERGADGAPAARHGSFSTVFRMVVRGRPYAVRFFHPPAGTSDREHHDQWQQRYERLSNYLNRNQTHEIIGMSWVSRGIRVDGREVPLLKMQWVEGRALDAWITRRVSQGRADAIRIMATNWRAAMRDLRARQIAHGDLHHGNVMVDSDGAMHFVDYDAMYVPTLQGLPNNEIGHQNYQHPGRTPALYGPRMDDFSSIVIYLSMLATAEDPNVWTRHHDDYQMLFRRSDFEHPRQSAVFATLAQSRSPEVRGLAARLMEYCEGRVEQVPDLETAIQQATVAARPWYAP